MTMVNLVCVDEVAPGSELTVCKYLQHVLTEQLVLPINTLMFFLPKTAKRDENAYVNQQAEYDEISIEAQLNNLFKCAAVDGRSRKQEHQIGVNCCEWNIKT